MKNFNRRDWLKTSVLGLGSIPLITGNLSAKTNSISTKNWSSESMLWEMNPMYKDVKMKARLLANENPFGPSSSVQKAIAESISLGNRYGHGDAAYLIDMLAEKEGVKPENIMLGPGSTDMLEKTAIVLCQKGGNVISADPSYMSLVNTAKAMGGDWKAVPLKADYSHDLDAMESAIDSETKLLYVCNPNNPMGAITDPAELKTFCKSASKKRPIFVDEAYLEFMEKPEDHTMVGLVQAGHDVMVARTFSKIHGMAGLRVGYLVATEERIKSITSMVRGTMGLCVTSLKGAIASLKDEKFIASCRKWNKESKEYTLDQVRSMGFDPITSHTSFMIFPIQQEGKAFAGKMMDQGVGIRVYSIADSPWCRVSMGTMDEMKLFVDALKTATT
ncbi:histidinol-phosphate transaminase [Cyclobacterium sp.]|uniref:pyridoxal phosphate-dependent aminotransferase n=1 Tax=Cyclobacterium sp. TaxID=1966343 RepID=UPI0019B14148|nr:histidinol-phosphate transaminase [Cyclobacterium sp.]MBD3628813.1 histidinol-phosphate aminotransferase family protein [Cyclobacterium sp.]